MIQALSNFEELATQAMIALNSAISLKIAILLRYKEFDQIAHLKQPDPSLYIDSEHFFRDAQAVAFLRKNAALPVNADPALNAADAFIRSEKECHRTNLRIDSIMSAGSAGYDIAYDIICRTRKNIKLILGRVPKLHVLPYGFGPGSTLSDPSRRCSILDKCLSTPSLTYSVVGLLPHISDNIFIRAIGRESDKSHIFDLVRSDSFTTVPKTALTDRGISIQPSMNMFFQLGIGRYIRSRLKTKGHIDILSSQPLHRDLARAGSKSGELATIDLSAASDSISQALVKAILPEDWFELLDRCRVKSTKMQDRTYYLSKFSAMGNGYTFELETLIFYSIALACSEFHKQTGLVPGWNFSVYGDDIIVPSENTDLLIRALNILGFKTNASKTFVEGPFRESCGGDFFYGDNVTPFYIKELPSEPNQWITLYNQLSGNPLFNGSVGRHCRQLILGSIPADIRRCRGPAERLGDIVLNSTNPREWSVKEKNCIRYIRTYQPTMKNVGYYDRSGEPLYGFGLLAGALMGLRTEGFTRRGKITHYMFKYVECS